MYAPKTKLPAELVPDPAVTMVMAASPEDIRPALVRSPPGGPREGPIGLLTASFKFAVFFTGHGTSVVVQIPEDITMLGTDIDHEPFGLCVEFLVRTRLGHLFVVLVGI